jgi:hypothetical protein
MLIVFVIQHPLTIQDRASPMESSGYQPLGKGAEIDRQMFQSNCHLEYRLNASSLSKATGDLRKLMVLEGCL